MSLKERVKFDLDILKSVLLIVITALCAVFGYAITNIEILTKKQIAFGSMASFVLVIALALIIKALVINRKKLEEFE